MSLRLAAVRRPVCCQFDSAMSTRAVALAVLAAAVWWALPAPPLQRVGERLRALEQVGRAAQATADQRRVAVGYGGCSDVFAPATLLPPKPLAAAPRHYSSIADRDQLLSSFAYYFQHGAAAERFMSDGALFDELVSFAEKDPTSHWAIGGNAPVMAMRFFQEGCDVLLASKITARLQEALPKGMRTAGDLAEKDDVHLILEYKADTIWGAYKAPRANRYILHNDENNPMVSSLEPFGKLLPEFNANLLVVSGLQMMDSFPYLPGVREERLDKIKKQMIDQSESTLIHFEMASYVETKLVMDLIDTIIPFSDSLGMNEQELANLHQTLESGKVSTVADSNPRVATSLDQMRRIFKIIRKKSVDVSNSRSLSRIHVHTLAYQAIMTVKDSEWKQNKLAAAKASLTAHRHVCATDSISLAESKLVMDDSFSTSTHQNAERINFDPDDPVSCWDEDVDVDGETSSVEICVAPVLVCTNARQTAGAGDNISAAGLAFQI